MEKNWKTYKKLHKWPGLVISFVLLYYGVTGIIMNHRDWFGGIDFNRKIMPGNYAYNKWNNAAIKGSAIAGKDSLLIYGNVGIWLTDSTYSHFTGFSKGFPKGSDRNKIFDILADSKGNLYAAALSGLYGYDKEKGSWIKFQIADKEERFTALECTGDTIYALNRSHLFAGSSHGSKTIFRQLSLPAPPGYDNKITLFQTIWQIHSGEIFGIPGKVYVDLLGLITIFLSVTGIIWFFFPGWIKRRMQKGKDPSRLVKTGKWSLKWHNKAGAWTFILLIILFFSGIFLRPPLLIAIGNARVHKIKYTHLDQPNPWYDKLRDILWDPERKTFLLAASDGIYYMNKNDFQPVPSQSQPPISVMGINVFEKAGSDNYLVGSFSGLFLWNPTNGHIIEAVTCEPYRETGFGRPVGERKVTGIVHDLRGNTYFADYSEGVESLSEAPAFPEMTDDMLKQSKISFWNLCLEIHTGRIFEFLTGSFYILIVPLAGMAAITVTFSGYMLWRRKYRKKGYNNIY
ncbi:MAG: PepSY-associated TM helix domain-containing protein [Bacteroidales bacterium]